MVIADGRLHRIVAFTPDGRLAWTAGRRGDGPGEFNDVRGIACRADSEVILVLDDAGQRIESFDSAGRFVRQIDLSGLDAGVLRIGGQLPTGQIVLFSHVGGQYGARFLVATVQGSSLSVQHRFEVLEQPEGTPPAQIAVVPDVAVAGDLISVGGIGRVEVTLRRSNGAVTMLLRNQPSPLRAPVFIVDHEGGASKNGGTTTPAFALADGGWLVYSEWPDVEDLRGSLRRARAESVSGRFTPTPTLDAIDRFDASGAPIARYSPARDLPGWQGRPVAAGAPGIIYTLVEDPDPVVLRLQSTLGPARR